ncbi:MAG: hypothetical protein K2X93_05565 [Candidatus Obscuribacterales bacterium]|nr:hypothetical protein [Candidatus Obscuribacterales bacterium]
MRVVSALTLRKSVSLVIVSVLLVSCEVKKLELPGIGGGGPSTWEDCVSQAQAKQNVGAYADAEVLYTRAIDLAKAKFGENDARTGTCIGYLAGMSMAKQDWKVAYTHYKRWKSVMQQVDPQGEQMKVIDNDLKKIKQKLMQYNLVPDEVLKKRAARKMEQQKRDAESKDEAKGDSKDESKDEE